MDMCAKRLFFDFHKMWFDSIFRLSGPDFY